MEHKFISFEDEVANKFCYDIDQKKIDVHFDGYNFKNESIQESCVLIIESWTTAKAKLNSEKKYIDLENHIGVISMIFDFELAEDKLHLTINTLDNRYLDIYFENPKVKCMVNGKNIL